MRKQIPPDIEAIQFDLIVIGGGINGVAIARDAAQRGLRVVLVEKDDLAAGTTSWSTRLIHGGLRYLEHREFRLVRESLVERERLLQNAPHLVTPIPMTLPIYTGSRHRPGAIRAGMTLYDLFSRGKSMPRHSMLTAGETSRRIPGINTAGFQGAALYYDAQARYPERLTVELALSARQYGAIILTHVAAGRLVMDGAVVRGLDVADEITGNRFRLSGSSVMNVAGPWVDMVLAQQPGAAETRLIGGTRGTHIFVKPYAGSPATAVYTEARSDGRPIFLIPWNNWLMIGTTDARYEGNPDDAVPEAWELDYLLAEFRSLFPGQRLNPADIHFAYAGVRPLPYAAKGQEGGITRRHFIHDHAPAIRGLASITGGKLTTHRSLAEEAVDHVVGQLGKTAHSGTADLAFPGALPSVMLRHEASVVHRHAEARSLRHVPNNSGFFVPQNDIVEASVSRLNGIYGSRANRVWQLATDEPDLASAVAADSSILAAEIVFCLRDEFACTLTDLMTRRMMLTWDDGMGLELAEAIAAIAAKETGWSPAQTQREIAAYRSYAARFQPPFD